MNLVSANYVLFFDSDWNPQMDKQAESRAHRIGQEKYVTVVRFVTKGSVEDFMLKRTREKLEITKAVIEDGGFGTQSSSQGSSQNSQSTVSPSNEFLISLFKQSSNFLKSTPADESESATSPSAKKNLFPLIDISDTEIEFILTPPSHGNPSSGPPDPPPSSTIKQINLEHEEKEEESADDLSPVSVGKKRSRSPTMAKKRTAVKKKAKNEKYTLSADVEVIALNRTSPSKNSAPPLVHSSDDDSASDISILSSDDDDHHRPFDNDLSLSLGGGTSSLDDDPFDLQGESASVNFLMGDVTNPQPPSSAAGPLIIAKYLLPPFPFLPLSCLLFPTFSFALPLLLFPLFLF